MNSLLYLLDLILTTIIVNQCASAEFYPHRRYELPDIQFYYQHKYAVNNISMQLLDDEENYYNIYAKSYKVNVAFSQPRDFRGLRWRYQQYKLMYRVWMASINSPAKFHSQGFIDLNLEKMEFNLNDILVGPLYFIRIFTTTDSMTETLSSLKFFQIKRRNPHFGQSPRSSIEIYDNIYAPGMELNVEKKSLNYGYTLKLTLYNYALQRDVKAYQIDLEKNFAITNSTMISSRQNVVILRYMIPYVRNDEYVLRVFSVLHNNVIASEYSISMFFVIP